MKLLVFEDVGKWNDHCKAHILHLHENTISLLFSSLTTAHYDALHRRWIVERYNKPLQNTPRPWRQAIHISLGGMAAEVGFDAYRVSLIDSLKRDIAFVPVWTVQIVFKWCLSCIAFCLLLDASMRALPNKNVYTRGLNSSCSPWTRVTVDAWNPFWRKLPCPFTFLFLL
jgi:hypothetical protein